MLGRGLFIGIFGVNSFLGDNIANGRVILVRQLIPYNKASEISYLSNMIPMFMPN